MFSSEFGINPAMILALHDGISGVVAGHHECGALTRGRNGIAGPAESSAVNCMT